jgi:hypothetical protein
MAAMSVMLVELMAASTVVYLADATVAKMAA